MTDTGAADAVWHFDVISPFAYLALPAVEALARLTGAGKRLRGLFP